MDYYNGDERKTIEGLYEDLDRCFDEIAELVAQSFNYPEASQRSEEQSSLLHQDVQDCIDSWNADVEMQPVPPKLPIHSQTKLQILLKRHFEIGELLMDIDSEAMDRTFGDGGELGDIE